MRVRVPLLLLMFAAGVASAAPRPFPHAAKKDMLYPDSERINAVHIGSELLPLAPGALIRDRRNMIVLRNALREPARVRYQLDAAGRVFRIWILTPEEAEQADE